MKNLFIAIILTLTFSSIVYSAWYFSPTQQLIRQNEEMYQELLQRQANSKQSQLNIGNWNATDEEACDGFMYKIDYLDINATVRQITIRDCVYGTKRITIQNLLDGSSTVVFDNSD